MSAPHQIFHLRGIHRFDWSERSSDHDDALDLLLHFTDTKGRRLPQGLALERFHANVRELDEGLYSAASEIRVLDLRDDGRQVEFSRFCIQFLCDGQVIGETFADSAIPFNEPPIRPPAGLSFPT